MRTDKAARALRGMTSAALFAAMVSVMSQLALPMPSGLPLTLQTFAVCLCGYFLGVKSGITSIAVYILLGALGAPVFSGLRGGIHHLLSLSGGFIVGFIPLAALCGAGRKLKPYLAVIVGICGVLCCHVIGAVWHSYVSGTDIAGSLIFVLTAFGIKDIASCIAAYAVFTAIKRIPHTI